MRAIRLLALATSALIAGLGWDERHRWRARGKRRLRGLGRPKGGGFEDLVLPPSVYPDVASATGFE